VEAGVVREFRVGLGSLAPVPARARAAEAVILGAPVAGLALRFGAEARAALLADISPVDDLRSTANYRRTVAGNVLVQALGELEAALAG
jgi:CO/xanthine dehydrogenase FAD-binding subunit